ncbi:MAG TPA: metalloregulator ArsR/SmtB family transcription factor [Rhodobacteraceae bacterium]|nr:metalloregulator ArsR/SmtB family transcription factor [Paracoccaceae bacterium]
MEFTSMIDTLNALAQDTRLKAFRLLVRHGPEGLPAGRIALELGVPQNTLSSHLGRLACTGLVRQQRKGRAIIYSADLEHVRKLVMFLTMNCCDGRPELCESLVAGLTCSSSTPATKPHRLKNVLILCTGNSARSILGEALVNRLGKGRFRGYSAGSAPTGKVNPFALRLLRDKGYDTSHFRSKSWDEFAAEGAPPIDYVFTVCDNAAGEACPVWPGHPARAHWGLPDPAAATGSDANIMQAFEQAYESLEKRIAAFIALPLDRLSDERLKTELAAIGRQ